MTTIRPRSPIPLSLSLCAVALFAASCGESDAPGNTPSASPAMQKYVLQEDPGDALSVVEAKKTEAGTQVVVAGRVDQITKGAALFRLMDKALHYCGEVRPEGCKTPWDYCCETPETQKANRLLVEVRDANGQPIAADTLPELRLLDHVEVKGTLQHDAQGNPVLVADGWFRVERPQLVDGLNWPQ